MKAARRETLTSVKRTFIRHPAVTSVAVAVLIGLNALAFIRVFDSPWLFAGVIVADLLALGAGIAAARRQLARAGARQPARSLPAAALPCRASRPRRGVRPHRRHQPAHGRRHYPVGPARR